MGIVSRLAQWLPPGGEIFAFLGLGSNLGDRLSHLQAAVDGLADDPRSRLDAVSSVYETLPVGGRTDAPFLNMAVRLVTRRSPRSLLRRCHGIEAQRGRVRMQPWGPRTLDIDILLYDTRTMTDRRLRVPHPRLGERAFALVPLIEVAPGMALPDGRPLTSLLADLAPIEGIVQVGRQVTFEPGEIAPGGREHGV